MVTVFVFPTTAVRAGALPPRTWLDICLPIGRNELISFCLVRACSFCFFLLNCLYLNHKSFHLSSIFCLFIIRCTFVSVLTIEGLHSCIGVSTTSGEGSNR